MSCYNALGGLCRGNLKIVLCYAERSNCGILLAFDACTFSVSASVRACVCVQVNMLERVFTGVHTYTLCLHVYMYAFVRAWKCGWVERGMSIGEFVVMMVGKR